MVYMYMSPSASWNLVVDKLGLVCISQDLKIKVRESESARSKYLIITIVKIIFNGRSTATEHHCCSQDCTTLSCNILPGCLCIMSSSTCSYTTTTQACWWESVSGCFILAFLLNNVFKLVGDSGEDSSTSMFSFNNNTTFTEISYLQMLVPNTLRGASFFLAFYHGVEFTKAQTCARTSGFTICIIIIWVVWIFPLWGSTDCSELPIPSIPKLCTCIVYHMT